MCLRTFHDRPRQQVASWPVITVGPVYGENIMSHSYAHWMYQLWKWTTYNSRNHRLQGTTLIQRPPPYPPDIIYNTWNNGPKKPYLACSQLPTLFSHLLICHSQYNNVLFYNSYAKVDICQINNLGSVNGYLNSRWLTEIKTKWSIYATTHLRIDYPI